MSYELIVTSAKRALQAGRSGFAAVMRTRGMHPELQSRLESLSGYRHLFPQGDPRNPIIQAHSTIDSVAGKFSVFSRTVDAGSDYSGRSNKLSHHVAFDASEIRNAARSSPAAALQWLQRNGRFTSRWEGDPREQDPASPVAFPLSEPTKCVAWEAIAGDAGWAGVLVERTLKGLSTWLIVPAGTDPVGLFVEAMALMEPSKRWAVSFTTHAMSDTGFTWKVAAEGSTEAKVAQEQSSATAIDLTRPVRTDGDGPYIQAARGLADVPWKKLAAAKPANPGPPGTPARTSEKSPDVPSVAINHAGADIPPPTLRPAPPPLVKPPPVVRPPDVLGDTMPFPGLARGSGVARGNTSLIAAVIAVGITLTVLLGLLVDTQIRGEASVIRKVAALIPREQDEKEARGNGAQRPNKHRTQNSSRPPEANEDSVPPEEQSGSHDLPGTDDGAASEKADPVTPSPESIKEPKQQPNAAKEESAASPPPQHPIKPSTAENTGTPKSGADIGKTPVEGFFAPVREAVDSQNHLPKQSLLDGTADSASTLVVFKPGSPPPSIQKLVLVPVAGPLTLEVESRAGEESRWKCSATGDSATPVEVGTFVLNTKGISFEAAQARKDAVERLSRCCLLIVGKNGSETTYMQLSTPIEIKPVPFRLEHHQEDPRGVLQSQVRLPLPYLADIDASDDDGAVSLRINGVAATGASLFAVSAFPFKPPLEGQQAVSVLLDQPETQVQMEYQLTTGTSSLSLELVVGPFADKAQFDRMCKKIASGGNINFDLDFWTFVRSELTKAIPKTDEREPGGKTNGIRQARVLTSLQEKLKPRKKAAVPFAAYVDSLRDALLASPSLLANAEANVDKRHPPAPPSPKKEEPDGRDKGKKDKDETPTFDRDAEVMKEKESQFPVWCKERLSQLEVQRRKLAEPDGPKWTDADFDDYAALFLWSRIQHLEQYVKAFNLPEPPAGIEGTARVDVRRIWPTSTLPKEVSCRPETLLLRTTP